MPNRRIDRWLEGAPETVWLFALVAVPLMVNPAGRYGFSIYKAALLHVAVACLMALWLVKAARHQVRGEGAPDAQGSASARAKSRPVGTLVAPVLALTGVYLVSTLSSISPSTSFWGTPSRMEGITSRLALAAVFLVMAWECRSMAQVSRATWAMIAGGSLVSLFGVLEWLGWRPWLPALASSDWRINSTIGNPTALGAYLVLPAALLLGKLPPAWTAWRHAPQRRATLGLAGTGLLLLLHVTALLFTNARGPWLGAAAMALAFAAAYLVSTGRWRALRLAALGLALATVVVVALGVTTPLLQPVARPPHLFQTVQPQDIVPTSNRERVLIWGATWDLFASHPAVSPNGDPWNWLRPVLGYGPDTLRLTFQRVYPAELRRYGARDRIDRAHNLGLDLVAMAGILGLAAFAWVVGAFFLHCLRLLRRGQRGERQWLAAAAGSGVAGYLATQMVGISSPSDQLAFWALLAVVASVAHRDMAAEPVLDARDAALAEDGARPFAGRGWMPMGVAAVAALGILGSTAYASARLVQADMAVRAGVDRMGQGRLTEAAASFEDGLGSPPLRALSYAYLSDIYSSQALRGGDRAEQTRLLSLAAESIEKARRLEPVEAGYHQQAGLIYGYWALLPDPGKHEAASEAFAQAVAISPKDVATYSQWAELEARLGNYRKALELLGRSLEADPQWAPTYYQLGGVFAALGRNDEAAMSYREAIQTDPSLWQARFALAETLLAAGKATDAREVLEAYVLARPGDWAGHYLAARVYQGLGMTQAAREQAEAALSLAPAQQKALVQQVLDGLR